MKPAPAAHTVGSHRRRPAHHGKGRGGLAGWLMSPIPGHEDGGSSSYQVPSIEGFPQSSVTLTIMKNIMKGNGPDLRFSTSALLIFRDR